MCAYLGLLASPNASAATPASNDTPSESFLEYNHGKLEVRDGRVFLLAAGWAEYTPSFAAAGLTLHDGLTLSEFKQGVRAGARAGMHANDRALADQAARLETPAADKRFIRELLEGVPQTSTQSAQVIAFPTKSSGASV